MKVLPKNWRTERLLVRDATMQDVPHLRSVFNACSYVGEWDNKFYEETEEAFIQLVTKSLKLNRSAEEIFRCKAFCCPVERILLAISTSIIIRPCRAGYGFPCSWSTPIFRKIGMDQSSHMRYGTKSDSLASMRRYG